MHGEGIVFINFGSMPGLHILNITSCFYLQLYWQNILLILRILLNMILNIGRKNMWYMTDKNNNMFDTPGRKNHNIQASIMAPPKDMMNQEDFNCEYSQFTMDLPINSQIRNNLKYLFELYSEVCAFGGLINVISSNKMREIIDKMSIKFPQIKMLTIQNIIEHYIKSYLFSFEIVLKTNRKVEIQNLTNILIPKFVQKDELTKCLNDKNIGIKLFDEDIVVLCNACKELGFEYEQFNVKKMNQRYGAELINAIIQPTNEFNLVNQVVEDNRRAKFIQNNEEINIEIGFSKFGKNNDGMSDGKTELKTEKIQMSFSEYYQYFCSFPFESKQDRQRMLKSRLNLESEKYRVFYAQQFDAQDEYYNNQIYKRICGTFILYKQKFDLLSYADQDIPGVTLPSFSIKVKGCWQGGTQEPFGMPKIDINFGSEPVEWYCISVQNVKKFNATFKQEYGFVIDKVEGQWFQSLDWFIEKKIPIKRVIQNKGDIVIIGSGSMYWQKSKGKSLHASWNMLPKTQKQIIVTTSKPCKPQQNPNKLIRKDLKIPIKSILIRALNHQQYSYQTIKTQQQNQPIHITPSSFTIMRQYLKRCYIQQQKYLNQMIVRQQLLNTQFKLYNLYDNEAYCSQCNSQILIYFTNINGLKCMECTSKYFITRKINELANNIVYYKNDVFWMYQLIYYGNIRNTTENHTTIYYQEIKQLCRGQFITKNQNCTHSTRRCNKNIPTEVIDDVDKWQKIKQKYLQDELYENREASERQKIITIIIKKMEKQNQIKTLDQLIENIQNGESLAQLKFMKDRSFDQSVQKFFTAQTQKNHCKFEMKKQHQYNEQKVNKNVFNPSEVERKVITTKIESNSECESQRSRTRTSYVDNHQKNQGKKHSKIQKNRDCYDNFIMGSKKIKRDYYQQSSIYSHQNNRSIRNGFNGHRNNENYQKSHERKTNTIKHQRNNDDSDRKSEISHSNKGGKGKYLNNERNLQNQGKESKNKGYQYEKNERQERQERHDRVSKEHKNEKHENRYKENHKNSKTNYYDAIQYDQI